MSMNNLKDIHNMLLDIQHTAMLFYQDVNEQFEGYTQLDGWTAELYFVVLSGCQWTIWRIYTTTKRMLLGGLLLFYQDVNEQFEGYTQLCPMLLSITRVVLSGCQWTIWRIYTTDGKRIRFTATLFYQDVNDQFEGYTQHTETSRAATPCCFIRMSMNNLKDIHNAWSACWQGASVVLSGCQWTIWRIYTTPDSGEGDDDELFYQDVNEQFEGYTQLALPWGLVARCCFIRMSMNNLKDIHNALLRLGQRYLVVLSGCQWTIWRIYTTDGLLVQEFLTLFYQDVNEQFEGYTQHSALANDKLVRCFIRMSMNNLKDIHNWRAMDIPLACVVLSGCQWTIWRIYTTKLTARVNSAELFYQDVNEQFEGYTQLYVIVSRDLSVVLSGCQWTIWRIYTTHSHTQTRRWLLFYQDVNEQFLKYKINIITLLKNDLFD